MKREGKGKAKKAASPQEVVVDEHDHEEGGVSLASEAGSDFIGFEEKTGTEEDNAAGQDTKAAEEQGAEIPDGEQKKKKRRRRGKKAQEGVIDENGRRQRYTVFVGTILRHSRFSFAFLSAF
jgi:hypothetical protein